MHFQAAIVASFFQQNSISFRPPPEIYCNKKQNYDYDMKAVWCNNAAPSISIVELEKIMQVNERDYTDCNVKVETQLLDIICNAIYAW